jgi:hypothetical protein
VDRFVAAAVAVLVVGAFVVFSPATGQDRTEERLSALETRVAVLEQRVKAGSVGEATTEVPETTYTLTGEISLLGLDNSFTLTAPSCVGDGGYDDFREGTGVTVRDQAGAIIATGSLTGGRRPGSSGNSCAFLFTIPGVPYSAFYSVEVSHRGELEYSFEEMESMGWHLQLEIGD